MTVTCFLLCALLGGSPPQGDFAAAKRLFETNARPLEALQKYVEAHPNDPWGWHFLGRAETVSRRLSRAEDAFRRGIELDPKQSWHSAELGQVHRRHSDQLAVNRAYSLAASLEPDSAQRGVMQNHADVSVGIADRIANARMTNYLTLVGFFICCLLGFGCCRRAKKNTQPSK